MKLGPLLAWTVVSLLPSVARADAIDGPPSDCPPGSIGESSHSGSWCEPSVCERDADCAKRDRSGNGKHRFRCEEAALCVEHTRSERWRGSGIEERDIARRACAADGTCVRPEQCVTAKRCVLVDDRRSAAREGRDEGDRERGSSPSARGCGCSIPGDPRGAAIGVGLAIAGLALVRRRRER